MNRVALPLLVVFLMAGLPAQASDWTGFHGNELGTGYDSTADLGADDTALWSNATGASVEATPLSVELRSGTLAIVADRDGVVRALRAEDGTEAWNATMDDEVIGTPVAYGDRLFVVDVAGNLRAFDLETGADTGDEVSVGATRGSPVVHEGKIFIGNEAGVVSAYETHTLTNLWSFTVSSAYESSETDAMTGAVTCEDALPAREVRGTPVVYKGNVIFTSLNQNVYAIDEQGTPARKSTTVKWVFPTDGALFGSPAVDHGNGRVVVGSYDGKVYSIPATPTDQGEDECFGAHPSAAWSYQVPADIGQSAIRSTAAIDGSKAYLGAFNGHLYALDLKTGKKSWDRDLGGHVTSSAAVADGLVVAASESGRVVWLSTSDGSEKGRVDLDSPVYANPALGSGGVLVADSSGTIRFYGPGEPAAPDLAASATTFTDGQLHLTITNLGLAPSANTTVEVFVDGVSLATLDLPALAAATAHTFDLDGSWAEGSHAVRVEVDPADDVAESNESNSSSFAFDVVGEAPTPTEATPTEQDDGPKRVPGPGLLLGLVALGMAALLRRRLPW